MDIGALTGHLMLMPFVPAHQLTTADGDGGYVDDLRPPITNQPGCPRPSLAVDSMTPVKWGSRKQAMVLTRS